MHLWGKRYVTGRFPYHNRRSFYPVWLVVLKTLDTACSNKERHIEQLKGLGKEIDDYAHKREDKMKSNVSVRCVAMTTKILSPGFHK